MFIFLNKSTLDIPYTQIFEISGYYKSMHAFKTHFIIINELHFESPFFLFSMQLWKSQCLPKIL